ncbi:MAG: VWA domain-containing protein [Helicobacter sp.]|uniref:vWA domain-containing protein n=1 Tax=Helicobacter sp. TaxID=218 RepID=UPI002A9109E2|nr:VWA domain-containing protein [Helicobacter sp.]MDY5951020.1 VWA domain-containing protein [Helicobacter sp.]
MDKKSQLPTLRKVGNIVAKPSNTGKIKPIDKESLKKKSEIDKILKQDSIKSQMKKEQQAKKGLDLVLIGDLTGSMRNYHRILKQKFKEICKNMFQVIPNLRIGIIFYLDHGSGDPYVTKVKSLTINIEELQNFIDTTPDGCGGDADEAVEDALYEALNLNWSEINTRSIVLFGDARAHEPNECDKGYDYFKLTQNLYNQQTTINTVFCGHCGDYRQISSLYDVEIGNFDTRVSRLDNEQFFSWLANVTGGVAIGVAQIDDLVDIIQAMAAKDAGKIDDLEEEVKKINTKALPTLKFIKEKAKQIEHKKQALGISYNKS